MPSKRKRPLLRASSKKSTTQPSNPFDEKWKKLHRTTERKKLQRKQKPWNNRVFDNRIGEKDSNLDDQSRYLFRLQRERAKRVKKSARFSLNDEQDSDERPEQFPSLEQMDEPELSEGDEGSVLDAPRDEEAQPFFSLKQAEDEQEEISQSEPRTKREVMHEVIEKSKMFKTLRQHLKHQTDEQTMQLDEELPQLMQLLTHSHPHLLSEKPKLALKPVTRKRASIFNDDDGQTSKEETGNPSFHYEDVYVQLAQEKRSAPSERLLTEEEAAQRQKEELIKMEKLRNARMNSIDDDEKDRGQAGGDDLNDDFSVYQQDSDESEEESDSDSDTESTAVENINGSHTDIPANSLLALHGAGVKEIPFVYKRAPSSVADLQKLFEGTTIPQRSLIMDRLVKCFAASLNPGKNRPKLIRLSEIALQRSLSLCRVNERFSVALTEIDMLVAHVHKLGFEQVVNAWGRRQVLQSYSALVEGKGSLSERWGVYDVLVLRIVGALFPASDARHPVSTPLQILLSEALSVERMKSIGDIALGVLIANILLEMLAEAERFSPQLAVFSCEVLRASAGIGKLSNLLKYSHELDAMNTALSVSEVAMILSGSDFEEKVIAAKVINAAACLAEELTFSGRIPHADLVLSRLPLEELPHEIGKRMKAACERAKRGRLPLQLYTKSNNKQSFKLRNPRFSSESGVFRKRPRSSFDAVSNGDVAASAKRIRRALKKEERGLARDVRREAELYVAEKDEEQRIVREDRDARDKTVRAFFETQRSTWRAAEKRQKKLSGKKW
ncbi:Nucleolar protein [Gracilaria domingensis]|nr:Nucleolar protein [Gracilaria domingensis]